MGGNLTSHGPVFDIIIYAVIALVVFVIVTLIVKCCWKILKRRRARSTWIPQSLSAVEEGVLPSRSRIPTSSTVCATVNETATDCNTYRRQPKNRTVPLQYNTKRSLNRHWNDTTIASTSASNNFRPNSVISNGHFQGHSTLSPNLVRNFRNSKRQVPSSPPTKSKLRVSTKKKSSRAGSKFRKNFAYSLTIATDATPKNVGGYCIDFATQNCEFYSFPTSSLPKCLRVTQHLNSAEFEMNNLTFALLHWEPLILERKRIFLYTDNNAIREKGIRPEHGEKVRVYLNHLEKCLGVKLLNRRRHHVNRNTRPAEFQKYIVPADDLSRGNIEEFREKILNSYPKIVDFTELGPSALLEANDEV